MSANGRRTGIPLGIGLVLLVVPTAIAMTTGLWVLTAIPVGVLFGFFLQKGDLCGASAISEVVLFRDRRKLFGLWVAIVVSMLGFAALGLLGWVKLNPKPLVWANLVLGGTIFGVGTVLAGGCVSGALYKTGTGNLNSMAALVAIPIGVAVVEYGPLGPLNKNLKKLVVEADGGGRVTFGSVTGLPFWVLALLIAAITVGAVLWWRREAGGKTKPEGMVRGESPGWWRRSWKPWQAGIAIGILGALAYLSSAASGRNYPLGVTHGVLHLELLAFDRDVEHVWKKPAPRAPAPAAAEAPPAEKKAPPPPPRRKVVWWLVALVTSMVAGSWISAKLSGQVKLVPRPPTETIVAFFGGLLVGGGAGLAKGCVIGNILSGIGLMSVGTVLFAVCVVLANWAATYVYLMGGLSGAGSSSDRP
jgi:uncharacterized membrane protein YedE/YeeE